MPPSGFSQKALNGLLMFVEACYEDLLQEIKTGKKTESQAIKEELDNIKNKIIASIEKTLKKFRTTSAHFQLRP